MGRIDAQWRFAALLGACALAAHDVIWFVELGPGAALASALRSGGHAYWPIITAAILATIAIAGTATAARLLRLRALVARRGGNHRTTIRSGYSARFTRLWLILGPAVTGAFTIQENVEHVIEQGPAVGLGALVGPEHPLALAILVAVSAVGAAIGAALSQSEAVLLARLSASWVSPRRRPRSIRWQADSSPMRPRPHPIAASLAGRAPPVRILPRL
jgi:hypothetical protein